MPEDIKQENSGEGAIQILGSDNVTVLQIGQLLSQLAESTLQANFFAATGIRCGPHARHALEALMRNGFDGYALGLAWNRRLLRWDSAQAKLLVHIGIEVPFAFGMLGVLAVAFGGLGIAMMHVGYGQKTLLPFSGAALVLVVTLLIIWIRRSVEPPVRTAIAVRKGL